MRFRYASYAIEPSTTCPDGILYRPEATINVIGSRRAERIQALVDTGSDETVFPLSLAGMIGVELDHGSASEATAVGGHEIRIVPGVVTLEMVQGQQKFRWQAIVGFLENDDPNNDVALLGYAGFLEFFRATFDSQQRELSLEANERFVSARSG